VRRLGRPGTAGGGVGVMLAHVGSPRGREVFEHTLVVLGQHLGQVAGHGVGPEEVVVEGRIGVDAFGRVQDQELVEQVAAVGVLDVRFEALLDPPLLPFEQFDLRVEFEVFDAWPHVRGDRAAQLADEVQLLLVGVALHDGAPRPHLGHDATGAPKVHGGAVVPVSEEQFGGPVPQSNHAICIPEEEKRTAVKPA